MIRAPKLYDPWLFWLAMTATVLGLFFIFDAGYARSVQNNKGALPKEFYIQLGCSVVAIFAAAKCSKISAEAWKKYSKLVWLLSLALLILVLIVGKEMGGAKRWILGIQPSEFAKLATIVYLAGVFADRALWSAVRRPTKGIGPWLDHNLIPKFKRCLPAIWVLLAVLLIDKEPDLGTAAVVGVIAFVMFALGRANWATMACGLAVAFAGVYFIVKSQPYRTERILNHTTRWTAKNVDDTGYQTVQAELAQATGHLVGVGIGAGRAKLIIPAPTTDFIMGTIGEEFGVVGSLSVLAILGGICWRLMILARKARTDFGRLVLTGTACWLGIQATVNVMMANAFLPAIGIPLPFISSGGSSLVALWMTLGVCNSVLAPAPAKEVAYAPRRNRWRNRRARLSGA